MPLPVARSSGQIVPSSTLPLTGATGAVAIESALLAASRVQAVARSAGQIVPASTVPLTGASGSTPIESALLPASRTLATAR